MIVAGRVKSARRWYKNGYELGYDGQGWHTQHKPPFRHSVDSFGGFQQHYLQPCIPMLGSKSCMVVVTEEPRSCSLCERNFRTQREDASNCITNVTLLLSALTGAGITSSGVRAALHSCGFIVAQAFNAMIVGR